MLSSDYREEFEDGKLLLYVRNGIFYARVYVGSRKYLHKSLKTSKLESARKLAQKYFYEIEFRQTENLPLQQKSFNDVIDEYVAMRERDYERSKNIPNTISNQQHTTIYMLRQIKRVVKFWREYCGEMPVDKVGDAALRDYIDWRKEYYRNKKPEDIPRNARIDPKDKTLEWEVTLAKMLIRYAHERGYRGKAELPQWRFKAKRKIVRPAFTVSEYAQIYRSFRHWIREVDVQKAEARYMRETLRDYVHTNSPCA